MKITDYGTAAGEAWPGVFCRCELCEKARALGGKNIRTRSQTLVNDDLLLDLPPENHMHSLLYGLDLSKVEALLFTHSHSDHCYPEDLEFLREPYSHTRKSLLEVYGNTAVERRLLETGVSLGGAGDGFPGFGPLPCPSGLCPAGSRPGAYPVPPAAGTGYVPQGGCVDKGLHRIIRQGSSARDFVPVQSFKNGGILYVFPVFETAEMAQKIR